MRRRAWLKALAGALLLPARPATAQAPFALVVPGRTLRFPADEGSHPDFRIEWWYITGWLNGNAPPLGFQVTFFRARPHADSGNPSRFDPKEILVGHAAISEASHGRLRHAQRIARSGFGLAAASTQRMDVHIDDWYLRSRDTVYATRIVAEDLGLELQFSRTQPPLLQGDNGFSRKGPQPESASYYYSLPHLAVQGRVRTGKVSRSVTGSAWLDHEWSSEYMDTNAVGWDWIGINLDDGGALMAFRMRTRQGVQHWAGASLRAADGKTRTFHPHEIGWQAKRWWRSPRTGAEYPVAMRVTLAEVAVDLDPMMDDQENDTRLSTGAVYWEGAVTVRRDGSRIGRGYLELTGYTSPLRM